MDRNEARTLFQEAGLTYGDVTEEDIGLLREMVKSELEIYKASGDDHAIAMDMTLSTPRKKDTHVLKRTGLKSARIQVDGSYFKRREAITFSETGFIGFGGELDDKNVAPILSAFAHWVRQKKEKTN